MKSYSQKYLALASLVTGILISSVTMAAVPSNVANTKHNFSTSGLSSAFKASAASGMTQVCVFCHTPHNAGQTNLLWNKAGNGNTSFRLYTSSGSLTSITKASTLPAGSPSLLCLGCHDGKTAMNILHSASAPGALDANAIDNSYPVGSKLIPTETGGNTVLVMPPAFPDPFTGFMGPNMAIGDSNGQDLTNDHPIGFSYTAVLGEDATGLKPLATAETAGVKFFGTSKRVECSSCHDPHVDTTSDPSYAPFLVMSNTGSNLCLSCHDK